MPSLAYLHHPHHPAPCDNLLENGVTNVVWTANVHLPCPCPLPTTSAWTTMATILITFLHHSQPFYRFKYPPPICSAMPHISSKQHQQCQQVQDSLILTPLPNLQDHANDGGQVSTYGPWNQNKEGNYPTFCTHHLWLKDDYDEGAGNQ